MTSTESRQRAGMERFDSIAAAWDDNPGRVAIARAVAQAITQAVPLAGTERALELGCGTGLLTALLARGLGRVTAADNSRGMLDVLRRKLAELDIRNVEALETDLSRHMPAGPFDLVFSSMTLHHVEDVAALLRRVFGSVAPGGRVAFADLDREDGSFHSPDVPDVMHHGFEREQLARWLGAAGFADAQVRTAHVIRRPGPDGSMREYPVLLATARRGDGAAA